MRCYIDYTGLSNDEMTSYKTYYLTNYLNNKYLMRWRHTWDCSRAQTIVWTTKLKKFKHNFYYIKIIFSVFILKFRVNILDIDIGILNLRIDNLKFFE